MKYIVRITLTYLFLISCLNYSFAKAWHGLTPLRSTQQDVIHIMGSPIVDPITNRSFYEVPEGRVSLMMVRPLCELVPSGQPGNDYLLRNLVAAISIRLKNPVPINEIDFRWKTFYVKTDIDTGESYYSDNNEGISYSVLYGKVIKVHYSPTKKDMQEWYEKRERCRRVP